MGTKWGYWEQGGVLMTRTVPYAWNLSNCKRGHVWSSKKKFCAKFCQNVKQKQKQKGNSGHKCMSRALGKGYGMKCGHNGNISRNQWEFWRWNLLGTWWEPYGIHWEHHDPSKIQPLALSPRKRKAQKN